MAVGNEINRAGKNQDNGTTKGRQIIYKIVSNVYFKRKR
jgi:hypothetical protein